MTTATIQKPSDSSLRYLTDLVQKRQTEPGLTAADSLAKLTRWLAKEPRSQKEVSAMIDRVKAKPARTVWAPVTVGSAEVYVPYPAVPDSVPDAKFAVLTELLTEAPESWRKQEYLFFEIKVLKHKRVVRRLLGAPGAFKRTGVPADLAKELFGRLEDQSFAYASTLAFAEIYQVCGKCSAELTDTDSRARKFGPICWDLLSPWRQAAALEAMGLE